MICYTMNKRKNPENLLVRESIFLALMQLMENKNFDDITVTEITARAGVSRMAYYRNYKDKKEILLAYLDELFENYWRHVYNEPQDDFQSACLYFNYFRENKSFITTLLNTGLSQLILNRHNLYLKTIFKDLYSHISLESMEEKYVISFLSGGLFKILIDWTDNDMNESNESMAKIVCALMKL